jgi:hypothetical protein
MSPALVRERARSMMRFLFDLQIARNRRIAALTCREGGWSK